MRSFDKFKQKMSLSGGSLRGEHIRDSKLLLNETFADDASFALGIYFWELNKESYDNDNTLQIRIFDRKFSAAQGVTMKFQTLIDSPVIVGDVVYSSVDDEYLICTESYKIGDVHWQGKFTLCNWILKWQDKNGDILNYPCYDINATQYNSGEQSNKHFTIGSSQHILMLPSDKNTVALKTPQRFFLDKNYDVPTVFIVTQNDTTSYNFGKKGIVRLTVMEDAYNVDRDRIDLGICDYMEPFDGAADTADTSIAPLSSTLYKSTISFNTDVLKSGGSPQVFTAKFLDENGNEVVGISPSWKIVSDFNDSLQVVECDNSIEISIDDDSCIDEEFKIILSDLEGNVPSSLIVKVRSLL